MDKLYLGTKGFFCTYKKPFCNDSFHLFFEDKEKRIVELGPQINAADINAICHCINQLNIKRPKCVELGAWIGHSTCLIGLMAKLSGGSLTTIDTFKGNPGACNDQLNVDIKKILKRNLKKYGLSWHVKIIEGESRSVRFPIDFIFIDANHTFKEVDADIRHWWPMVRPGGIMAGHDLDATTYDEKLIDKDCVNYVHHGVVKAVLANFPTGVNWYNAHKSSVWYVKKEK